MAKQTSRDSGPVGQAMMVLGAGVVAAVVIGLVYGLLIGNVPRGLGQGGAVVMIIAAVVGVGITYRADARRKQTGR
jgi:mannose/fructose/N-acetylgalactosamine-specific phosphotransferase system component IIC